jgi:hypothetical protein
MYSKCILALSPPLRPNLTGVTYELHILVKIYFNLKLFKKVIETYEKGM